MNEKHINREGEAATLQLQWLLAALSVPTIAPMGKTPEVTTKDTRGAGSM